MSLNKYLSNFYMDERRLFQILEDEINLKKIRVDELICKTCHVTFNVSEEKIYYCPECGVIRTMFIIHPDDNYVKPIFPVYHRYDYFRSRIRNMCLSIEPKKHHKYRKCLRKLKGIKFETIFELRTIIRDKKISGVKRNIYQLYLEITGKKALSLNQDQITTLVNDYKRIQNDLIAYSKRFVDFDLLIHYMMKKRRWKNSNLIGENQKFSKKVKKFIAFLCEYFNIEQ